MPPRHAVTMRVSRASQGHRDAAHAANVRRYALRGLGLEATWRRHLTVAPPSYRFDLQLEEDLIEEVVRLVGYDKFPDHAAVGPDVPKLLPSRDARPFVARRLLAGLGYQETINFSFVEESWERELAGNRADPVINPIASQMSVMRSCLLGSLLQVVKFNTGRRGQSCTGLRNRASFPARLSIVERWSIGCRIRPTHACRGSALARPTNMQWA